jgi:3-dehydroquinate synthase
VTLDTSNLDAILDLCAQDKKNEGNTQLFSLLPSLGDCSFNTPVTREEIKHAILYYQQLSLA